MKLKVRNTETYASTGGKEFDPGLPTVMFIHGSGLDHRGDKGSTITYPLCVDAQQVVEGRPDVDVLH